ncbi:MAG: hypothetical protein AVO35_02500 [Candidatus Aegiribacteria sp. MLS_C]|nr:MAG: hypothetical protein AVO35_02500 [Candidatus Aegiribacteria sp. MLS_C]
MRNDSIIQVVTTVDSELEGDRMASEAVIRKLAACAQVLGPITSHYRWKGEMRREKEWMVLFKTSSSLESELYGLIDEMHPYETPELISLPISSVHPSYLQWIGSGLREQ